jgi:hypothetical protein
MSTGDYTFGNGSTISIKDATDTFLPIAGIESIPEVGVEATLEDVTDLTDTVKQYEDNPLLEGSDFAIEYKKRKQANPDPGQDYLYQQSVARAKVTFQITYSDGTTSTFDVKLKGSKNTQVEKGAILKRASTGKIVSEPVGGVAA